MAEEEIGMNTTNNGILPTDNKDLNTSGNITKEMLLEPKQDTKKNLTKIESNAIKAMMAECMETPKQKKSLFKAIKKDLPSVSDQSLYRLWRETTNDYYQNLKRIPSEALLNIINEKHEQRTEKYEELNQRILDESTADITKQVEAIVKTDMVLVKSEQLIAQINKLNEMAPVMQINFHQPMSLNKLLNPNDTQDNVPINITPQDIDTK